MRMMMCRVVKSRAVAGALSLRALDGSATSFRRELDASGFDVDDRVCVVHEADLEALAKKAKQWDSLGEGVAT